MQKNQYSKVAVINIEFFFFFGEMKHTVLYDIISTDFNVFGQARCNIKIMMPPVHSLAKRLYLHKSNSKKVMSSR